MKIYIFKTMLLVQALSIILSLYGENNQELAPLGSTGIQLHGVIQQSDSSSYVPEYTILFRGSQTKSNSEGFFIFPLSGEKLETFLRYRLLLVKRVNYVYEKINTISTLQIPESEPYRLYDCVKNSAAEWDFTEITNHIDKAAVVTDDTLIVLVNPKYIDRVESWKISLHSSIVKGPKIILKETGQNARAATKSVLGALDGQVFHETIVHQYRYPESGKAKISIVK